MLNVHQKTYPGWFLGEVWPVVLTDTSEHGSRTLRGRCHWVADVNGSYRLLPTLCRILAPGRSGCQVDVTAVPLSRGSESWDCPHSAGQGSTWQHGRMGTPCHKIKNSHEWSVHQSFLKSKSEWIYCNDFMKVKNRVYIHVPICTCTYNKFTLKAKLLFPVVQNLF